MDVYKDSNGDYWCKICNTKYTRFDEAMVCVEKHAPKEQPLVIKNSSEKDVAEYKSQMNDNNTIESAKKLVLSLIEDYHMSKEADFQSRKTVSPMTLKLGENAANSLMQLNKLIYGEKSSSVNINVEAKKKSDVEALRDMIVGKRKPTEVIDGEAVDKD